MARRSLIVLLVAAGALAPAGCGDDEGGTPTNQPAAQGTGTAAGNAVTQPSGKGTTQGGEPSTSAQVDVSMKDIAYVPPTVTARRGETIVWTNDDSVAHTVTQKVEGGPGPDSPTIAPGGTFKYTPTQKGSIGYFCRIHPNQEGTIVVK